MALTDSIINAYKYNKKVGRQKIYWAVDIHDTIAHSNYADEMPTVIPEAIEALKILQAFPETVLILFSSSYHHAQYIEHFMKQGVYFKYFNENPEVCDTATGDFSKKFYYNVLIDDKAGFVQDDWNEVLNTTRVYRIGFLD